MPQAQANIELLTAARQFIIDSATANGVDLSQVFDTKQEFEHFVISQTIRQVVALGHDTQTAYDIVMGEGAYDQLKADVAERVKG